MLSLYTDHAADIRVGAYIIITGFYMIWAAEAGHNGQRWRATILFMTGMFFVGSLHFSLTRNPSIPLVFTTPVVVLLALACMIYLFRGLNE